MEILLILGVVLGVIFWFLFMTIAIVILAASFKFILNPLLYWL